jgi:hypothetical protein
MLLARVPSARGRLTRNCVLFEVAARREQAGDSARARTLSAIESTGAEQCITAF